MLPTNRRLHRNWIVMILVLPMLVFNYTAFIKIKAWRRHSFERWCGKWLIIIRTIISFTNFIHFVSMFVSDRINQRSHKKRSIRIADVMLTYFICAIQTYQLIRTFDDHITNESLGSIPSFSHDIVHLFDAYDNRNRRKIKFSSVIGQMNDYHHQ